MLTPGVTFGLGNVLANNVPPTALAGGPYSGAEGSLITFTGSQSASICGFPTLVWSFSDGGVAYGAHPQHTFEAPGSYSGLLTATDAAGLTDTTTFTVTVSDLPPVVTPGPSITTEWGVPVTLSGSATDPRTAQQPFLSYTWQFGDGSGGAGGANVTHSYAAPGRYAPTFTACDPEGMCASSSTTVTVTQRGTILSYTGALSATVTDAVTLTASLVDDRGSVVVGRTVQFFADGAAIPFATASTNSLGVASVQYAFPLGSVGTHSIVATFAGDGMYLPASSTGAVVPVAKDGTVLAYTGVTAVKPAHTATLSAKLTDDAGRALPGMTVTLTLGAQECSAVTNASGVAGCSISKVSEKNGTYSLMAAFGGTGDYVSSATSSGFKVG